MSHQNKIEPKSSDSSHDQNETKENLNKREQIISLLKEVLYNSLAQAIIKIFLSPFIIIKVILFMFVLTSTGLASFLVISSVMTYFTYGVSTTSRTIYETPTLFPKVTFCNFNRITTEYGFKLIQSRKIIEVDYLSVEEQKKIARDFNEILLNCTFELKTCNSSDFVWSYDPFYGNCYTFNSGFDSNGNRIDFKKSPLSGYVAGLQLTLYVNVYENLLNTGFVNGLGALFQIGNNSYITYYGVNGIRVAPGYSTNIAVDREFNSIMPKPYSNCDIDSMFKLDSDLFNLISQSKYQYTQQLCLTQCFQQYLINHLNCTVSLILNLFNVTRVCDNLAISLYSNSSFVSKFYSDICLPLCPLECSQTFYKTSLSSIFLPGDPYVNLIQNSNLSSDFIHRTINAATAEKSIINANIFYDSLSYKESTESPQMDIVSLLASIGGNLGLFLGVSVFSLCEIVEVIIEIYFIIGSGRSKKI